MMPKIDFDLQELNRTDSCKGLPGEKKLLGVFQYADMVFLEERVL